MAFFGKEEADDRSSEFKSVQKSDVKDDEFCDTESSYTSCSIQSSMLDESSSASRTKISDSENSLCTSELDTVNVETSTENTISHRTEQLHIQGSHEQEFDDNCENSDEDYKSADDGENDNDSDADDESDDFIPTSDLLTGEDTEINDAEWTDSDLKELNDPVDENGEGEGEGEKHPTTEETEQVDPLKTRRKLEESLSKDEKEERRSRSQKIKDNGNVMFRQGQYEEAILSYTEALDLCPLDYHKERSIMFANRAACKMKQDDFESAISDSSSALELHPHYLKALLRRAELYEKTEKLDDALKDYQKVIELDPSHHASRASCIRLSEEIKERNEKMKDEMIGKLKDLGNMVLRPFGLSVNNFNLQQDPSTGSYSVQFNQNPGNGT